jgi:hypothetical protein
MSGRVAIASCTALIVAIAGAFGIAVCVENFA